MDMQKIQSIIKDFSKQRDWDKFHNPKNLSMALSVEASELVEIFQWLDFEQASNLTAEKKEHTKQELADIAVYKNVYGFRYKLRRSNIRKNEIK